VIGFVSLALIVAIGGTIFSLFDRGKKFLLTFAGFSNHLLAHVVSHTWVLLALLMIEIFVLLHHWDEHGKRGRESSLLYGLGLLLADLTAQNAIFAHLDGDERFVAAGDFYRKFYEAFAAFLQEREIEGLDVSIMRFDQSDNCLKIVGIVPIPPRIVGDFQPRSGVGGAGNAFKSGNLIYLPSIRYGHGIEYEVSPPDPKNSGAETHPRRDEKVQMKLIPQVYVPVAKEPFKSIVSVPITNAFSERIGVVNYSSSHSNAFSTAEFNLLLLSGRILGFLQE
jgi:hypothetical protein